MIRFRDIGATGAADNMAQATLEVSTTRGPRVLSFDGGGVRGLSSLLILRRLMYMIEPNEDLYSLPRPSDHFDMICGTSTGGLLAIMLGRLNMGVQECIDAYCELAREVFQKKRSNVPLSKWIGPAFGQARFNCEKLEEAVKRMVKRKLGNDQVPMRDDRENACKVFVCATRTANTKLALLRSYHDPEEEGPNCTIWQAARATTAAPAFFSSISFGKPLAEYVDGGLLNNNPIRILMREATRVWGHDVDFSCVLSIGTGAPPGRKLGSLGHQVLIACEKIATETETTAQDFKADQNHNLVQKKKYFRFNVAHGLQNIQLEEWQVMDLIDAATKTYLHDVAADVKDCSGAIKGLPDTIVSPSSRHSSGQDFVYPESPQILALGRSRRGTMTSVISGSPTSHHRSDSNPNPNPKPLYWDLPGTASPYFTDRDDLLAGLHDFFKSPHRKDPQVAVLNGLGGMGKTQIALQYIERHRSDYMGVFFVDGTSEQGLQSAFARIAHLVIEEEMRQSPGRTYDDIEKTLGFSGLVNSPSRRPLVENWERIVGAVQRWFGRLSRKFLVVLDGVDSPGDVHIDNFIPYNTTADVILTTTDSTAKAYGHMFEVKEMPEDAALDLLNRASHNLLVGEESRSEGLRIVKELGGLPLAINQAGAYLVTSEPDITEFLPTYKAHAKDLLSKIPLDGKNRYRKSAFTTWELSYEKLLSTAPISAKLLELLSFVYPKDICPALYNPGEDARSVKPRKGQRMRRNSVTKNINVEAGFSDLNKNWVTKIDPYFFKEAFASLTQFCLVNRTAENYAYTVHPVVHLWARERLSTEDRITYARDAVLLVARALPSLHRENHAEAWKIHRRLLPHVQACWENFCKYVTHSEDEDDEFLLQALSILAISKKAQGLNREAAEIFRRVLRGRERVLGPEHQDTLYTLDYLASFYDQQGNLSEAENYYKRVLDGCERTLGENHPNTLTVVHDLAGVYEYRGKIREAEKLYQRALDGRESQLGPEDPDVLTTLDALGGLYDHEGRIGKAEELRQRAFAGREKVLGSDHPDTITTALNLGAMYSEQGKLKLAEEMLVRACEGREKFFGPQHPHTLFALNSLAGLQGASGRLDQAEKVYRKVLAARKQVLGLEHPDTLWTMNGLGGLLLNKGKIDEAKLLLEQASTGFDNALGPDHTDSLWVKHNLAIVYETVDRLDEADEMHRRALDGHIRSLTRAHPATLWLMTDMGACYAREGKLEDAEATFRDAYDGKLKMFGLHHTSTLYTANCLAGALWALERYEEAEELYKNTLDAMKQTIGDDHPDTCCCMCDMGGLYISQKRFDEAEEILTKCHDTGNRVLGVDHPHMERVREKLQQLRVQRSLPAGHRNSNEPRKAQTLPTTWGFGHRRKRDERQWAFIG